MDDGVNDLSRVLVPDDDHELIPRRAPELHALSVGHPVARRAGADSVHLADGHARDADEPQSIDDVVEPRRSDDGVDLLHLAPSPTHREPDPPIERWARLHSQIASSPFSPVRMRIASSMVLTKILPSPIFPVLAAFARAKTTSLRTASFTTISIMIFGTKSTT